MAKEIKELNVRLKVTDHQKTAHLDMNSAVLKNHINNQVKAEVKRQLKLNKER